MKNMKRTTTWGTVILAATLSHTAVMAGAPVRISAEVTHPENNTAPVTITVTSATGDTLYTRTARMARFAIRLPEDQQYTISFEQAHCVRKEVAIDARHAVRPGAEPKARRISFEVVLDFDPNEDMRYAGPVGRIDFHKGGRMQVKHDYALLRADRR